MTKPNTPERLSKIQALSEVPLFVLIEHSEFIQGYQDIDTGRRGDVVRVPFSKDNNIIVSTEGYCMAVVTAIFRELDQGRDVRFAHEDPRKIRDEDLSKWIL